MTPRQLKTLRKLAPRVLATCELTDEDLHMVQELVRRKLARDYADFYRRRTPLHIRLWGITPAGQAILTQQDQVTISTKRPILNFGPSYQEKKRKPS